MGLRGVIGQRLIATAAFLRATAVGAVGVFLAIALAERGLSLGAIGIVIGAGMAGGAVATAVVGARVDQRVGRRRLLVTFAVLRSEERRVGKGWRARWS